MRRRSVDHVMAELRAAVAQRPRLRAIAFSDDIFAPSRPWLEEFCARYKAEIGLPFVIYSFPRMVDERRVALMRDAGLWVTTMGIQSGSERIRRDCYERETTQQEIIEACNVLARHGVVRNLDFIGDNPYETDADREETLDLLCRLPKPFYFNYFSLTYFPGVDLTARALRDGHIRPRRHRGRGAEGLPPVGRPAHEPAARGAPRLGRRLRHGRPRLSQGVVLRMLRSRASSQNVHRFAAAMRRLQEVSRWRMRQ